MSPIGLAKGETPNGMSENKVDQTLFNSGSATPDNSERRRWMAVLARASTEELRNAWKELTERPNYRFLRQPEVGLAMVRGRAGGTGTRFNLGEMTVTRCVVETDDGLTGYAYVAGRDTEKAELAAAFDALLQGQAQGPSILRTLIGPLARNQARRVQERRAKVAATKVDFFTMVRGD